MGKFGFIGLLLAISTAAGADGLRWDLNDVSYLLRLPSEGASLPNHLLGPQSSGTKGELLPQDIYERIPTLLNSGNGNPTLYRRALRVIAMRFNPCPSFNANTCKPEVRMVWQPIERYRGDGPWVAQDGAIHSFYQLDDRAATELISGLSELKSEGSSYGVSTGGVSLGVHPALMNEQFSGIFSRKLNDLFLKFCGEENLLQVTFMSLLTPTQWWRFGGFVRQQNRQWQAMPIPRLDADLVDIFNTATEASSTSGAGGTALDGMINVLPDSYPERDNLLPLISNDMRFNDGRDLPIFKDKLAAIARFNNPHISRADEVDCASCHIADAGRFFAVQRFPELSEYRASEDYQQPDGEKFNLQNSTVRSHSTRIVRAFGYFNSVPAINQRAIHETAAAAHWLNQFQR